jgi:hypothetical protein
MRARRKTNSVFEIVAVVGCLALVDRASSIIFPACSLADTGSAILRTGGGRLAVSHSSPSSSSPLPHSAGAGTQLPSSHTGVERSARRSRRRRRPPSRSPPCTAQPRPRRSESSLRCTRYRFRRRIPPRRWHPSRPRSPVDRKSARSIHRTAVRPVRTVSFRSIPRRAGAQARSKIRRVQRAMLSRHSSSGSRCLADGRG